MPLHYIDGTLYTTSIEEHIQKATGLIADFAVFLNTFYQRSFTVLDSAVDWQELVTTLGRHTCSLEYVCTVFSDHAASWVRVCTGPEQMAEPEVASDCTYIAFGFDRDL